MQLEARRPNFFLEKSYYLGKGKNPVVKELTREAVYLSFNLFSPFFLQVITVFSVASHKTNV